MCFKEERKDLSDSEKHSLNNIALFCLVGLRNVSSLLLKFYLGHKNFSRAVLCFFFLWHMRVDFCIWKLQHLIKVI